MVDETKEKTKWYFTTTSLVIALLSVGPLALPLLWINPKYSTVKKMLWTLITLVLSYVLYVFTMDAFNKIMAQGREMGLIK